MSKVVPLHGGAITDDRRPDEEAVRKMNALAEMVRAGEITGFVLICEQHDGTYASLRAGPFSLDRMIGRLARMQHRLIRTAEGEDQ